MKKPTLAQLLGKQDWKPEPAAAAPAVATPFFDRIMANAEGNESFAALLAKITGPVEPAALPEFPTRECLTPEQVCRLTPLNAAALVHLDTCPWCRNMMAAAQPSAEEFERILRQAKQATETARRHEAAAY